MQIPWTCLHTWGLIVERDHLASSVPENLRHVIAGIHPASLWVYPTHLPFIIAVLFVKENGIAKQHIAFNDHLLLSCIFYVLSYEAFVTDHAPAIKGLCLV